MHARAFKRSLFLAAFLMAVSVAGWAQATASPTASQHLEKSR
jgi:hypothetical protein